MKVNIYFTLPVFHFLDDTDPKEQMNTLPSEDRPLQNGSIEEEDGDDENDEDELKGDTVGSKKDLTKKICEDKPKQKRKYSRLSMLRRRRCAHNEDESDLSEGFESDEEEDEEPQRGDNSGVPVNASLGKEGPGDMVGEQGVWESGSEEEEEGGTAFDVETDSDMNSQESRSDLEDMEDAASPAREQQHVEEEVEEKARPCRDNESTPPPTNGPLLSSDPSISSNLQAMSSQLFQAKRCFRLAPTFSNVLLRPSPTSNTPSDSTPSQEATPTPGDTPRHTSPEMANGTNDDGYPLSA